MSQLTLARRQLLARSAAGVATLSFASPLSLLANEGEKHPFKIGACDWNLGHRGKTSSLEFAKQLGFDGVQISMAPENLAKTEKRRQYLGASKKLDMEICSLGIGALHKAPYASDPRAEVYIQQCVEQMPKMGLKILLMPFFGKAAIKDKPELQKEVIRRLKKVAPQAEKAGVVLGLETTLNVEEHLAILDAVGSPAVQVYYDTANMHVRGYDIYKEIRQLGRERICEIHCKELKCLLGQGEIDFRKVRDAINDIGYRDWLVVEASIEKGKSIAECYAYNQKYLRKIFNA